MSNYVIHFQLLLHLYEITQATKYPNLWITDSDIIQICYMFRPSSGYHSDTTSATVSTSLRKLSSTRKRIFDVVQSEQTDAIPFAQTAVFTYKTCTTLKHSSLHVSVGHRHLQGDIPIFKADTCRTGYCSFYSYRTASYKSVSGKSCDRPHRHRFDWFPSVCL